MAPRRPAARTTNADSGDDDERMLLATEIVFGGRRSSAGAGTSAISAALRTMDAQSPLAGVFGDRSFFDVSADVREIVGGERLADVPAVSLLCGPEDVSVPFGEPEGISTSLADCLDRIARMCSMSIPRERLVAALLAGAIEDGLRRCCPNADDAMESLADAVAALDCSHAQSPEAAARLLGCAAACAAPFPLARALKQTPSAWRPLAVAAYAHSRADRHSAEDAQHTFDALVRLSLDHAFLAQPLFPRCGSQGAEPREPPTPQVEKATAEKKKKRTSAKAKLEVRPASAFFDRRPAVSPEHSGSGAETKADGRRRGQKLSSPPAEMEHRREELPPPSLSTKAKEADPVLATLPGTWRNTYPADGESALSAAFDALFRWTDGPRAALLSAWLEGHRAHVLDAHPARLRRLLRVWTLSGCGASLSAAALCALHVLGAADMDELSSILARWTPETANRQLPPEKLAALERDARLVHAAVRCALPPSSDAPGGLADALRTLLRALRPGQVPALIAAREALVRAETHVRLHAAMRGAHADLFSRL